MKTVEMTKAKSSLAEYAREAKKGPVMVTAEGKPVALLVSIRNADRETVSLSNNPQFLALIERSRARHQSQGGIPAEEMRHRLRKK